MNFKLKSSVLLKKETIKLIYNGFKEVFEGLG